MSHLFDAQPRSHPLLQPLVTLAADLPPTLDGPVPVKSMRLEAVYLLPGVDLRIYTTGNSFVEMRNRLTNHQGFSRLGRTWAGASFEGLAKLKANPPFQPTLNLAKP